MTSDESYDNIFLSGCEDVHVSSIFTSVTTWLLSLRGASRCAMLRVNAWLLSLTCLTRRPLPTLMSVSSDL